MRDKTRSSKKMGKMRGQQQRPVDVYNEHHEAMLKLGVAEDDKTYQRVTYAMLKAKSTPSGPQGLGVGRGKTEDAWFWRGGRTLGEISHVDSKKIAELTDDGE